MVDSIDGHDPTQIQISKSSKEPALYVSVNSYEIMLASRVGFNVSLRTNAKYN